MSLPAAVSLALGGHVLAIPGIGDLDHLEQNVAAAALPLTERTWPSYPA